MLYVPYFSTSFYLRYTVTSNKKMAGHLEFEIMRVDCISVAQWDAHLNGDQEVAGGIPAGSGNILS